MDEFTKKVHETALRNIKELAAINPTELIRRNELGDFALEEHDNDFEIIISFYNNLLELDFKKLPILFQNEIIKTVDESSTLVGMIKRLNVKNGEIAEQRKNISRKINEISSRTYDMGAKIFGNITFDNANVRTEQIKSKAEKTAKSIELISQELEDKNREADTIVQAMRAASPLAGIAVHAASFKDEAKYHKDESGKWLKAVGWIGSLTLAIALGLTVFYIRYSPGLTIDIAIQLAIAKVVVFSVLYFFLAWCGKNYRAHQHNWVVNRHRHNALNTFESFVQGSDDQDTRNAVLIKSLEAVFAPIGTAYSSHEYEPSTNPQILEIIRSAVQSNKPS